MQGDSVSGRADPCEGENWFVHDLFFVLGIYLIWVIIYQIFLVEGETQIDLGGREGALCEQRILMRCFNSYHYISTEH